MKYSETDLAYVYKFRKFRARYEINRAKRRIRVRKTSNDAHIRERLLLRQGHRCAGLRFNGVYLPCYRRISKRAQCDHIIELRYYGADVRENLQMLCRPCHVLKTKANRLKQACY